MGVALIDQEPASHQNYAMKLQTRLKWARENNKRESEHHKKYYDQRMTCMALKPNDLVLVHVKAPTGDHKMADRWEDTQYQVLSQLDDQPVFRVQPVDATADENIRVLHRNMLYPIQSVTDSDSVIEDKRHFALMKANLLMDIHFDN